MKCRNIVVFTANMYSKLNYTFVPEKYKGKKCIGKCINDTNIYTGIRYIETVFDFIKFFNT